MKRILILIALIIAMPAGAQVLTSTSKGVVAAHDGVIDLYDSRGRRVWSAPGLETPTSIVAGDDAVALLDAWTNRARVISLANGSGETFATNETPIGGLFLGDHLYILERDSRTVFGVRRLAAALDTVKAAASRRTPKLLAADPAFVGASDGLIYVYSRVEGLLQEIDPESLALLREVRIDPFASDMEIDGRTAYLIHPRSAKLTAVNLETFTAHTTAAGGTPIDIAVARSANALSATTLAIADPGAQRVWRIEGSQSFGAAFGRGFIRGLLGLGLFRPRSSEFPTGVDRIMSAAGVTVAHDSVSGTLYAVDGSTIRVVAQDVAPQGFTVRGDRIAIWRDGAVQFAE